MQKVLFLALMLFVPILIIAQQQPTVIKVSARAVHIDPTPIFKATVSLSSTNSNLSEEILTLDMLKKQYKDLLVAKGILWGNLKENPNDFGYESMGYNKAGVVYEYRTKSLEKMKKFLETRSVGVQYLNYVSIITIDEEEAKILSQKAIAIAKKRATTLAQTMGKQLGTIQEVEDLNNRWGEEVEQSVYYDRPSGEYLYMLNVIFTVK